MAGNVLTVRETGSDGSQGREISITDVEFAPLDFNALRDAKLHQRLDIPLRGRGRVHSTQGLDIHHGKIATFSTILESRFTSKAIGLVQGGWLPSALAHIANTVVLPDRCVVAQLASRLKDGITRDGSEPDFIDLFAANPVRINPLLFVLEGDQGSNPTPDQLRRHLAEARTKLRSALPNCEIVAGDDQGLRGVLGLIEDTREGGQRKQSFLLEINQYVKSPVSRQRRDVVWNRVVDAAARHGLPTASLVVLAALSAVVSPQKNNPAKGLLKFGQEYALADVYNALADIRALEILTALFGFFPHEHLMLCTADRDMAVFWVGVAASNFRVQDGRCTYDVNPTLLLPNISATHWGSVFGTSN
ncbi:hypothetical protein [Rhizobium sp. PEPV16]|uniref:hypothetical protein n=1 Tax=Rhizobium sp. PEPV16 TaxID=1820614 RepID=UPI00124D75AF|nr:hypothetical protein [Rhizobium sp. PEPV16]KAF5881359.1 hypothetical protein FY112_30755 [Rhizobium sp. PEPV16]